MASKVLFATCSVSDRRCIDEAVSNGIDVRVLDCFEEGHAHVQTHYPNRLLRASAHRSAVKAAVEAEQFDVAVIREESSDFVRYALLAQTLREARVRRVVVVCSDASRVSLYRRCGAHQVVEDTPDADLWQTLAPLVQVEVTAS